MEPHRIAVIGAGTMGAGIAQAAAQAGYRVALVDANADVLSSAIEKIHGFWAKGIEKGKTEPAQRDAWVAALTPHSGLDAAHDADLVIEAVPESMDLKKRIFKELDAIAPAHAILATNTSSLSVGTIASVTQRPEQVLGMHFFNPVPLMKLLELIRHDTTSEATMNVAKAVGTAMGKTTIVAADMPGFATSRLGIVLGNEAARMVEEGVASVEDIDTAMRLGYGHPMGPLALSDLVGLDVRHAITQYLASTLGGDQWKAPAITERLVAAGELGKKTGKGFYDWSSGQPVPREDL